jgi:hypothetical protein
MYIVQRYDGKVKVHEKLIGKDWEGSGYGLIEELSIHFFVRTKESHENYKNFNEYNH